MFGIYDTTQPNPIRNAANWAWSQVRSADNFGVPFHSLATNWTALTLDSNTYTANLFSDPSQTKVNANAQFVCALNNQTRTPPTLVIDSNTTVSLPGEGAGGTVLGWQTQTQLETSQNPSLPNNMYCENPTGSIAGMNTDLDYIMQSGYNLNNGQFVEVQTDVASDPGCAMQLEVANHYMQSTSTPPGVCPYPP